MVATRRPVLALLPVLVLALSACGGTDDDTSAPTTSSAPASSVPASTAPAATTSGQATYRATEKPSASTNDASTAAISDQAYTDVAPHHDVLEVTAAGVTRRSAARPSRTSCSG